MADAPVELVVATFDDEEGARQALDQLKAAHAEGLIETQGAAILRKDDRGELHIRETANWGNGRGAAVGPAVGLTAGRALLVPAGVGGLISGLGAKLHSFETGPRTDEELRDRLREVSEERDALLARLTQDEPLRTYQIELLKLQKHLEEEQIPMIVLFEGRDASGKGGTIRRITRFMNEKKYRVVTLGKPSMEQQTQWYFQRFVSHFPTGGEIVLFDRSWYNRALVEPVLGFCTRDQYRHFLKGVVGFEKDLVRQGTVLVKLYFSVDKDIQAQRFERRKTDPLRQWKLSEVDLQAQEYWDEFTIMKHRMLERTSTTQAPWTIIRSNSKRKARLNSMKVILGAVDYAGRNPSLEFTPDPRVVVSGADELARMDKERDQLGRSIS